jgi:2-polyprenyl-3-methyl-5-hydroxy-6-metoxy-1,4-benzoquinol methylase
MASYCSMKNEGCSIPCDLCGSRQVTVVSTLDRNRKYLRTVGCQECGLLWSDPRLVDTRRFYEHDYRVQYKGGYNPKSKHIYRAGKVAIDRYLRIRPRLEGRASLLDIGASAGEFLYLVAKAGFTAIGIEPSHGYGGYARSEYGLNVRPGFAQDHDFPEASFDVVTLWHVVEHLESPYANIQLAAKWLKPGGLLVVEVPNAEAICHAPINAFHIDHLYTFNQMNLAMMGAKAGLHCEEVALSPDCGNLTAFYVKNGDTPRADCRIPGNCERVVGVIRNHTNLRHYLRSYPYRRLLGRISRIVEEARSTRDFEGGRQCLDRLYAMVLPTRERSGIDPTGKFAINNS